MGKPILELTAEDIDKYASLPCCGDRLTIVSRSYKVNLLSNYHTIQTFLPGMLLRSEGGTVVTISSVLGYLGCASLCKTSPTSHHCRNTKGTQSRHCQYSALQSLMLT